MRAIRTTYIPELRRARMSLQAIYERVFAGAFARNISAFAAAEAANKITRIVAMVFIARSLSVEEIGIAALALTSFELIRIVTNNGIGQMIIGADDAKLGSVCERAHQLNFVLCGVAAALQVTAGILLSTQTGSVAFLWMCSCLAIVFLGMPFGLVRIFRALRRNRVDLVARINFQQISADNLLSLALAVSGFGAWALVLPKLLTFPIWLLGARRADQWKPDPTIVPADHSDFRKFCVPVLATETLKGFRLHLDKAIVAALLGIDALGIYFFAYNAGLGLAQTLSLAFSACLYPQLCKVGRDGSAIIHAWTKYTAYSLAGASCLFLLQIAAAPIYVPLIFGEAWRQAVPIVVTLCFAASPRFLSDCVSQLARAEKATQLETNITIVSSALAMMGLAAGAVIGGLSGAALGLVLAAWIVEPTGAVIIRQLIQQRRRAS